MAILHQFTVYFKESVALIFCVNRLNVYGRICRYEMGNYGPAHKILVLISLANREGLDEPWHIGSLARSFASHIDKNRSSRSLCQKFTSSTSGYVSINLQEFYLYSKTCLNPFMQNGISHCYKLDQSISILRVVRLYFSFLSNF